MHHAKHMIGCGAVLVAVVAIRALGDGVPGWVGGLVLLACPVMMIWMVVTMSRHDDRGDPSHHHAPGGGSTGDRARG